MSVADLFMSGRVEAGEGLFSGPGRVWIESSHNLSGTVRDIAVGNGIVIAVTDGTEIERSTDGGATFGSDIANNHTGSIESVCFGGGAFIAGDVTGGISKSTDGGTTWSSLISNDFDTNNDAVLGLAYATASGVWCAVGQATTYCRISADGGATWTTPTTNLSEYCDSVVYIGGTTFIAGAAASTNIYRSTDSGDTWSGPIEVSGSGSYVGYLVYENGALVVPVYPEDELWFSVDGGLTWSQSTVTGNPDSRLVAAAGLLWCGDTVSYDGGRTFTNVGPQGESLGPPVTPDAAAYEPINKNIVIGETASVYYSPWMQAGCGIVESGSNSNGNYRKFSDGTMVCYYNDATLRTASSASGNIYRAAVVTYTFPEAFLTGTVPTVVPRVNQSLGTVWMGDSGGTLDNTQVDLTMLGSGSGAQGYPGYIAIGRWK